MAPSGVGGDRHGAAGTPRRVGRTALTPCRTNTRMWLPEIAARHPAATRDTAGRPLTAKTATAHLTQAPPPIVRAAASREPDDRQIRVKRRCNSVHCPLHPRFEPRHRGSATDGEDRNGSPHPSAAADCPGRGKPRAGRSANSRQAPVQFGALPAPSAVRAATPGVGHLRRRPQWLTSPKRRRRLSGPRQAAGRTIGRLAVPKRRACWLDSRVLPTRECRKAGTPAPRHSRRWLARVVGAAPPQYRSSGPRLAAAQTIGEVALRAAAWRSRGAGKPAFRLSPGRAARARAHRCCTTLGPYLFQPLLQTSLGHDPRSAHPHLPPATAPATAAAAGLRPCRRPPASAAASGRA